ncbi:MAG: 50S ribosomal protein L22 [Chloroflexi bacterium]|nr:50S ribosomal protein L22 [Chloroflexota bacterium]
MEVKATTKYLRVSARKIRPVIDVIRGRRAEEALTILKFLTTPAARVVLKVVKSAVANAENNYEMSPQDLEIVHISTDEGPTMKRFRPRSRGRVSPILKRSSHITVVVRERQA